MSYSAAIDALSKPPPKVIAVKVVIPEGYTRRQIAELVHEDALSGDYLAASERSKLLSPRHYGAPRGTRNLEGFLFPATYDLRAGAPVQKLVDEQLIAFRRRFGSSDTRRAHALGVTPYEMLTVASMIEREAQSEHDRPLIAAVIYNRLREGIPLGIDATIYYAVEQQKGIATYTGELTQSMLKIDSPYNTRTHKGLPPTPISQPGRGLDPRGGAPGARALPVLRGGRGRLRRAGLLEVLRAVRKGRRGLRRRGEEERRQAAGVQEASDASPGRARLAGRAQPLAGDPQRGARGARDAATGATSCCRCRRSCSPRRRARSAAPASSGANVTIPHKQAALALADSASEAARAIGAANTLTFAADGAIAADNTDAPGSDRGDRRAAHRQARARAGRGGQRARRRSGRCARRARRRWRSGIAQRERAAALAHELGRTRGERAGARRAAGQLHGGRARAGAGGGDRAARPHAGADRRVRDGRRPRLPRAGDRAAGGGAGAGGAHARRAGDPRGAGRRSASSCGRDARRR